MGRSTVSCFRIISCAGDTIDRDDLRVPEHKGSSDKCGWSFRKRSARHRVLNNTVVSETSSGNKERPQSNFELQGQAGPPLVGKESARQGTDEKVQPPHLEDLKSLEAISVEDDEIKAGLALDESVVIIIQTSIRGFLAQRMLLKCMNVVKLQAAVRGHLVRNHAMGTLRCVQAIIKMQALVRARRARSSMEGSNINENDYFKSNLLGNDNSGSKATSTYTSIEKLLSNRFARQLMESTTMTKPIKIKCDPSKSDSAWKWLERWMSASSREFEQLQNPVMGTELIKPEKVEVFAVPVDTMVSLSPEGYESADTKSGNGDAAVPSEGEENLITYDADKFNFNSSLQASSPLRPNNVGQALSEREGILTVKENTLDFHPVEVKLSDSTSMSEPRQFSKKPIMESAQPLQSMKEISLEQSENEAKKLVIGSRKPSNPAFLAAQSKFVEMSSIGHSIRSNSPRDTEVECYAKTTASSLKGTFRMKEIGMTEDSISHTSRVRAGSECGTELSISSTLDSPDTSEAGVAEFDQEVKTSEDKPSEHKINGKIAVEASNEPTILGTELSHPIPVQLEGSNGCPNAELVTSVIPSDSLQGEQQPKENEIDMQIDLEPKMVQQSYKSSPEASPRSHITVPESQGTPSSQVSVKPKKSESERTVSNHKRRSLSSGKRSPNPNRDSGATSQLEQQSRDHKTGKRRNSLGSVRPDNVDQEPRDSTSSNSIPNYMQATESARAKALNNSSPRLSPDVNEKDIKKRLSLPGATGRQGSPRVQRSMAQTQAQESAKINEKKWQR